jgi:hypothetical protein
MTDKTDSRNADKFVVRLRQGQRDRIKDRARADSQSMNDTVICAVDRYLDQGGRFDKLLDLMDKTIQPDGGAFVMIKRSSLWAIVDAASDRLPASAPEMIEAAAALHIKP